MVALGWDYKRQFWFPQDKKKRWIGSVFFLATGHQRPHRKGIIQQNLLQEKLDDSRRRKFNDRQYNGQKGQTQFSTKHYTEN